MQSIVEFEFSEYLKTSKATIESIDPSVEVVTNLCIGSLKNGGKIFIFWNGGSAADAQHIVAELVGCYKDERKGLVAITLTTDTSTLTYIGNDYDYDRVFDHQVETLANKGDVAIGISIGNAIINAVNVLKSVNHLGCKTIEFGGRGGDEFNNICDINIVIPATEIARI